LEASKAAQRRTHSTTLARGSQTPENSGAIFDALHLREFPMTKLQTPRNKLSVNIEHRTSNVQLRNY
jgi:hypothetical protein